MSSPLFAGLDIGGTSCRWVVCDAAGSEIARGAAPGATGHAFNPAEFERLRVALQAVADGLAAHELRIAGLAAGITGYGAPVAGQIRGLASGIFGIAADRILLVDDIALAFAATFRPGEGHLVSAGTGSIGIHIGADGSYTRVGGRGILVDDAGSGSWIALRAVDAMFRSLDREGSFGSVPHLARCIFAITGGQDWHSVRQFIYGGDRGRIGALAVAVADAANKGDAVALSILQRSGFELALLAEALIARSGPKPIAFVGRVTLLHPCITEAIAERLGNATFSFPTSDAAQTAARLQTGAQPMWLSLLRNLAPL